VPAAVIERRHPPDHPPEAVGPNPSIFPPDDGKRRRHGKGEQGPAPRMARIVVSPISGYRTDAVRMIDSITSTETTAPVKILDTDR
jgi:hypothetical protein